MVGARTRAQIHPGRAYSSVVERFLDMEEVRSSILRTPTSFSFSIKELTPERFPVACEFFTRDSHVNEPSACELSSLH